MWCQSICLCRSNKSKFFSSAFHSSIFIALKCVSNEFSLKLLCIFKVIYLSVKLLYLLKYLTVKLIFKRETFKILQVLEKTGILSNIKRYSGVGSGAIVACLLAAGFSCNSLQQTVGEHLEKFLTGKNIKYWIFFIGYSLILPLSTLHITSSSLFELESLLQLINLVGS